MGKKKPNTPRSRIKSAIRRLWLYSRERAKALKNTKHCCDICGVKASVAKGKEIKLEVHHLDGIDWEELVNLVFEKVLVDPGRLQPLCTECHSKITGGTNGKDSKKERSR